MCLDYRRLNSVSRVEAYPMPRIDDELIDRLGKAKYITIHLGSHKGVLADASSQGGPLQDCVCCTIWFAQ